MAVQDTSLWAHELAAKNIGKKQKTVLDALRFFADATNAELGQRLGWPVNRITPRVLELRKIGLILEGGKRRCRVTGNTAHVWKAKHPVLPDAFKKPEPVEQANSLFP